MENCDDEIECLCKPPLHCLFCSMLMLILLQERAPCRRHRTLPPALTTSLLTRITAVAGRCFRRSTSALRSREEGAERWSDHSKIRRVEGVDEMAEVEAAEHRPASSG